VNSYHDISNPEESSPHMNTAGFGETFKLRSAPGARFADLLDKVAKEAPGVRFRFTSPNPKDFPSQLLEVIRDNPNVCKCIHLPAQAGSTEVLRTMRRNHTREAYLDLVDEIRSTIPGVTLSTDLIAGFCGETEEQFEETVSLIEKVGYDFGFLFAYSMREKTHAHRKLIDDVQEEVKQRRLQRMISVFREKQLERNNANIGLIHLVLVDGIGKLPNQMKGKTDGFKSMVFDGQDKVKKGDWVAVKTTHASSAGLFGDLITIIPGGLQEWNEISGGRGFIEEWKHKAK